MTARAAVAAARGRVAASSGGAGAARTLCHGPPTPPRFAATLTRTRACGARTEGPRHSALPVCLAPRAHRYSTEARRQNLKEFVSSAKPSELSTTEAGQGLPLWFYVFPVVTFVLGTWQVFRWQEKKEMIRYRKERLLSPTVSLPSHLTTEDVKDFEFRHVEVSGSFEPIREFLVRPRTRDGQNGALLITPFRRSDDGTLILVNRGWIPAAMMTDEVQRRKMRERVRGETKLFGLLRPGEKGGLFSPENKLADEQWYWFETDKMRQALQLPYTPPLLDLLQPSAPHSGKDTYPVPQPIVTKLRDNHLNYIITWYSLTASLVAILVLKGRRIRRV